MLETVSATPEVIDGKYVGVAWPEISGVKRLVEVSGVRVNMSFNVEVN